MLLFTILLGTLFQGTIPFNLFELLWLHTIIDFVIIFAFILEKPSTGLLLENIVKYEDPLLNEHIMKFILIIGGYETTLLFVIQKISNIFSFQSESLGFRWEEETGVMGTIVFQTFFYFII